MPGGVGARQPIMVLYRSLDLWKACQITKRQRNALYGSHGHEREGKKNKEDPQRRDGYLKIHKLFTIHINSMPWIATLIV